MWQSVLKSSYQSLYLSAAEHVSNRVYPMLANMIVIEYQYAYIPLFYS